MDYKRANNEENKKARGEASSAAHKQEKFGESVGKENRISCQELEEKAAKFKDTEQPVSSIYRCLACERLGMLYPFVHMGNIKEALKSKNYHFWPAREAVRQVVYKGMLEGEWKRPVNTLDPIFPQLAQNIEVYKDKIALDIYSVSKIQFSKAHDE